MPLKQIGTIFQPQPQPLARHRRQAQRIMRGVVPGDRPSMQAIARFRQSGVIDRVVLKHHKRVEQLAQSNQALDLGQTKMLVRHQPRLAVLKFGKQISNRLVGRKLHPQRQRVDEQTHHALDAGNLRRPPRHRDPEHHVVAPGQPAKQHRPGSLDVSC